jgi:hypothetical protein
MKLTWNEVETQVPQYIHENVDELTIECRKNDDGTLLLIEKTAITNQHNGKGPGVLTLFLKEK